jgi:sec-independent protein translocase protein TatB
MFDVAPTEFLLVAVVALLVIGPQDLPKAMRFVGHWMGKARGMARHFRSGIDAMVRESELEEMEKKWQEENARIMEKYSAREPHSLALAPPGHVPEQAEDGSMDGEAVALSAEADRVTPGGDSSASALATPADPLSAVDPASGRKPKRARSRKPV